MALLDEMMMNPQSMGLLGLGSGLLQASGPSRMPITLGQAIGGALPMGVQGAQQAYAMRQQDELNKLRREMMALEMEQAKRAEEARRRQEQGLAMVDDALTERERDVTLPPLTPNDDEGNVNPQIQGRMKTIDQAGAMRGLRQAFPQEYAKLMFNNAFKENDKPVVVGRSLLDPKTGRIVGTDATWSEEQRAAREDRAERERRAAEERRFLAGLVGGRPDKPPAGFRFKADGTLEAIPGGPADTKLQGQFNQDTAAMTTSTNAMDRLASAANEAMNHPGLKSVTGLRGAIPNLPGTAAADAAAKLNTLKSQVAFGVLQEMRNNSKTGGALGAVSDAEGKRLEANLAALESSQSYEQMRDSLRKIVEYTEQAKGRIRDAYNMKHGNKPSAPAPGGIKFMGFE